MSGLIKGTGYTADNPTPVKIPANISTLNSTTVTLGIGGVFTGTEERVNGCGIIYVSTYSDQASATDGLQIEQSSDGTNWDHCDEFTIPAAMGKSFSINPHSKWMRVVYTNGAIAQTEFRLQTITKANGLPSSHRIQDPISTDDDAELVKSVLTGKSDVDGIFRNVVVTKQGNLQTVDKGDGLSIAAGDIAGTTYEHKFGNTPDFDSTDSGLFGVDIWDGANDAGIDEMQYTYSSSADIDSISSSDASDTQDIIISGLDSGYNLVSQVATLAGQTRVALTTPLIRAFRMENNGTVVTAGQIYCYVNTAIVAGVPTDTSKVRAIINDGTNQTLMALYTVPSGKTAYLRSFYASTAGAKKDANYVIDLRIRPFGGVFLLKHRAAISDFATSTINHIYIEPQLYPEKTDIAMRVSIPEPGITQASVSSGFDLVLVDNV